MRTPAWLPPVFLLACTAVACERMEPAPVDAPAPPPLRDVCAAFSEPAIVEVTPDVLVATGYDLSNVILVKTDAGNVIVDTGLTRQAARAMRTDLLARAPGEIAAVILTHSHIDHVGGASIWAGEDTPIWGTAKLEEHFLKQYSFFTPTERRRGQRQYGTHVSDDELPCTGIGPRPDIEAANSSGARLPNHTFETQQTLEIGGRIFELVAAPGETSDELFVWIPDQRVLLPGDNYYRAFPNVYTIRGTQPRPIDDWIDSLDAMRRLAPEHLVPSHTGPVSGADQIAETLTAYRDALQWVRDETARRANAGQTPDQIAEQIELPASLKSEASLAELYGRVDWSARAVYGNELGWFGERTVDLYPLSPTSLRAHEVEAFGGADAVLERARQARSNGELRWAASLLSRLPDNPDARFELAATYRELAAQTSNTNGRAWLLEAAWELEHPAHKQPRPPSVDDVLLQQVPIRVFFEQMALGLRADEAANVLESVVFVFPDEDTRVFVTVRNQIAEVAVGEPLPGTPTPVATVTVDAADWRRLAVGNVSRLKAITAGMLDVNKGELGAFRKFMGRFEKRR